MFGLETTPSCQCRREHSMNKSPLRHGEARGRKSVIPVTYLASTSGIHPLIEGRMAPLFGLEGIPMKKLIAATLVAFALSTPTISTQAMAFDISTIDGIPSNMKDTIAKQSGGRVTNKQSTQQGGQQGQQQQAGQGAQQQQQ